MGYSNDGVALRTYLRRWVVPPLKEGGSSHEPLVMGSLSSYFEVDLKQDIHHKIVLLHSNQQPVCFPPIQSDPYRWVIDKGSKMHYRSFRSPFSPSPKRDENFSFWREYPPLPALISPVSVPRTFPVPNAPRIRVIYRPPRRIVLDCNYALTSFSALPVLFK
ncbi:hypothetical protein AVEN_121028-1 [Araneus ventricosus]|uniref:Uncharacterized protein n=1 Tax=Araneus ventricosus TaxID=182803 RepID=A0A4Y2F390_ARAVE|nr:hypothetical protein AVEN_121028-1 [Araneus ventricosus]